MKDLEIIGWIQKIEDIMKKLFLIILLSNLALYFFSNWYFYLYSWSWNWSIGHNVKKFNLNTSMHIQLIKKIVFQNLIIFGEELMICLIKDSFILCSCSLLLKLLFSVFIISNINHIPMLIHFMVSHYFLLYFISLYISYLWFGISSFLLDLFEHLIKIHIEEDGDLSMKD